MFHIFQRPSGQRELGCWIIANSPPFRFCLPGHNLQSKCWQASSTMKLHAAQIFRIISTASFVRGCRFKIEILLPPGGITTGMMW
jgi:hypothetical protein